MIIPLTKKDLALRVKHGDRQPRDRTPDHDWSKKLAEDTEAFVASGGKVSFIPTGVSANVDGVYTKTNISKEKPLYKKQENGNED